MYKVLPLVDQVDDKNGHQKVMRPQKFYDILNLKINQHYGEIVPWKVSHHMLTT